MIARMKKLTAAIAAHDTDAVCRELVFLSAVEVSDFDGGALPGGVTVNGSKISLSDAEKKQASVASAIETLSKYGSKKAAKLFCVVSKNEFEARAGELPEALETANRVTALNAEKNTLMNERNRIDAQLASLAPFEKYDEPLGLESLPDVRIVKGTFPQAVKQETVHAALSQTDIAYELCTVSEQGGYRYVYAVVHRSDYDALTEEMRRLGFSAVSFDRTLGRAVDEMAKLRNERAEKQKALDALPEKYAALAEKLPLLKNAYDYLSSVIETERVKDSLASTETVKLLSGYVPAGYCDRVTKTLDAFDCAYSLQDVREDEKPPIFLVNNRFSAPFESVLSLYSYPDYHGIDPTGVLSVFYFIIFGMVMQDVGYGLLLLLGCPLLGKILHPPKGGMMDKLLRMFAICGISTVVCGVLFGGYFGDLPGAVAKMLGVKDFPNLALLFDPVANPVTHLVISLALGAIHLISGMCMKGYMLIKRGQTLDAVCDVGIWLVVFLGIGLFVTVPSVGKWVLIAGVAGLILTQGRAEKNPVMKLAKGVMSLYDAVGYASDLLSYSRIMALGLSGAIIGQVVNNIGTLGGKSVVSIIVLPLAFLLGHGMNFALSLLSAFVHTARLQYIEFLGKFYEDGGKAFTPASVKTKYSAIEEPIEK